jgi:multiple sugar transport system permease protein
MRHKEKNMKINYRKIVFFLLAILLLCFLLLAIGPFILMILTSFTDKKDIDFIFNPSTFHINNYIRIFNNLNIGRNLLNSIIVTGSACILNCIISSMAAYGFAKKSFPGKNKFFIIYLATMMIPGQVCLIPIFTIIRVMGLMNTYPALFLPIINAFGVFLIRQFMFNVPDELLESAKIDGASEPRLFTAMVIPLIQPVLVSLTIFTFISSWNDFLWPLVIASKPEMHTLTLAISVLKGNYSTNYGLVMAGSTLSFLPPFVLFMILQKQFVEGIALSGIKA